MEGRKGRIDITANLRQEIKIDCELMGGWKEGKIDITANLRQEIKIDCELMGGWKEGKEG